MDAKDASDNPLLTYVDAGKVAGVSHSTISKWAKQGHLPTVPMPGSSRRRVRKQTLLSFLDTLETSESFASIESLPSED